MKKWVTSTNKTNNIRTNKKNGTMMIKNKRKSHEFTTLYLH